EEWSGNIRELAARVKKYVATSNPNDLLYDRSEGMGKEPLEEALPQQVVMPPPSQNGHAAASRTENKGDKKQFTPLKEAVKRAVEETERNLIEEALRHTLWNRRKAAKLLKVSYSSLLRRMEAYSIGKKTTV